MTALVKFEDHIDGKTTLVFLHNGKHIIINSLQIFSSKDMESVFENFEVPESMRNDVREAINTLDCEASNDDLKLIVSSHPPYLKFIDNQTPELCLAAVKNDGRAIQFVKDQTPEICLAAVKNDGNAIRFVKDKSMVAQIA